MVEELGEVVEEVDGFVVKGVVEEVVKGFVKELTEAQAVDAVEVEQSIGDVDDLLWFFSTSESSEHSSMPSLGTKSSSSSSFSVINSASLVSSQYLPTILVTRFLFSRGDLTISAYNAASFSLLALHSFSSDDLEPSSCPLNSGRSRLVIQWMRTLTADRLHTFLFSCLVA